MTLWQKCTGAYFTTMAGYGFYRGYNNLFYTDKFNQREFLFMVNIKNGILGALWQVNPAFQPIFIYNILVRTEKQLRNIPLEKIDYYG
jgi:hypothetical protein